MKRLITTIGIAAMFLGSVTLSPALAFQRLAIVSNNTAVASVASIPVSITTQWKNRSDDTNALRGEFLGSGSGGAINLTQDNFVISAQYLETTIHCNDIGWGACLYLRNAADDANPKYTGPVTGEIKKGLIHTTSTERVISLKWAAIKPNGTEPANNWTDVETWRWMIDTSIPPDPANPDFGGNSDYQTNSGDLNYCTFLNETKALAFEGNSVELYFLADFRGAASGSYKTNAITVESYFN